MNNIIWLILDSCRYDTFVSASTPNFDTIGRTQKRYSYASWTLPSHFNFLMGLLPHSAPKKVFAAEVYKQDFEQWRKRIGSPLEISLEKMLPRFNLVYLLNNLGYRTIARVSLPVLHPATVLSEYFYDYRLMENHNSFREIVETVNFRPDQPSFYFLNLGETHYPYMLNDSKLPHISGLHGILRKMSDPDPGREEPEKSAKKSFLSEEDMERLKLQQIKAVEYCDTLFAVLLKKCPANTYFIITSDHGELFGEEGYFGHGPVIHEKVFEVPFIEGMPSK
jgi:hypothetical protein